MPNRNYMSGRRFEYKLVNDLKKRNFALVMRTAGSHSPIDVIAVSSSWNRVYFFQLKGNKAGFSKKEKKKLEKKYRWLNSNMQTLFMVVDRKSNIWG